MGICGRKVALVTGASRGIGAQTASLLAKEGYAVAVNYNSSEGQAGELCRSLCADGCFAQAFKADITDSAQVEQMRVEISESLGEPELLVNNAGVSSIALLTDISDEEWDRIINTNLRGAFYCCRAFLPAMIRNKSGCIINIASMWGEVGASCEAVYSASKAGLIGLSKALAKEVGASGVRVNCVSPGVVATDMNSALSGEALEALREETPLGCIGTPLQVAQVVAFLASEKADFITGQVISPNGGLII